MRRHATPPARDPDFDSSPTPAGPRPSAEVVAFYQRLVVNPFLWVAALSGVCAAATLILTPARRASVFPPLLVVACWLLYPLVQYHCLDCGKTAGFRRWRRHACPRVRERWATTRPDQSRFVTAPTQLALWVLGTCLIALLAVTSVARR